ncbi:MAG TPA: hypothetical protein VGB17_09165 [Pyrinomonadaceae bacterium]|jgi:hypothetical protein
MRFHPGLLALGLLLAVVLACSGGSNNNNNNNGNNANNANNANNSNSSRSSTSGGRIDELYMAKEENGAAGDRTDSFSSSDKTVYVVAQLNKAESGTKIKFTWYAVDVAGEPKNSKIKDIEYSTGALENKITAHLTLPKEWPKGSYRVETTVNGTPDKSIEYTVE